MGCSRIGAIIANGVTNVSGSAARVTKVSPVPQKRVLYSILNRCTNNRFRVNQRAQFPITSKNSKPAPPEVRVCTVTAAHFGTELWREREYSSSVAHEWLAGRTPRQFLDSVIAYLNFRAGVAWRPLSDRYNTQRWDYVTAANEINSAWVNFSAPACACKYCVTGPLAPVAGFPTPKTEHQGESLAEVTA